MRVLLDNIQWDWHALGALGTLVLAATAVATYLMQRRSAARRKADVVTQKAEEPSTKVGINSNEDTHIKSSTITITNVQNRNQ